jgi:hypothetical protein
MAEFPRFLDEPYALEKNRIDRAMALWRDRAYGRPSSLPERARARCARMGARRSRIRRDLETRPEMVTIRRGEADARGETDRPHPSKGSQGGGEAARLRATPREAVAHGGPMTHRTWLAPSPHITAVLAWDAFLHALCDDHPHPE